MRTHRNSNTEIAEQKKATSLTTVGPTQDVPARVSGANRLCIYYARVRLVPAWFVINPITVNSFAFLFNCTPIGRAIDLLMDPT